MAPHNRSGFHIVDSAAASGRRVVVAIGGNALDESLATRGPRSPISSAAFGIARLVAAGWQVVVTHGNGPQVGEILLRSELSDSPLVAPLTLETCVAQTEGDLGHNLSCAILAELADSRMRDRVACLLTHTVVSSSDAGFENPSKPIGRVFERLLGEEEARRRGWAMIEEGLGLRRVVPSPQPLRVLEMDQILTLSRAGFVVIAAGGGGIPVVESAPGKYVGVDAVIDKDRASALLAAELGAPYLLLCTSVERVALHFGQPNQHYLDRMTISEATRHMADGQFAAGSMGPKVEAAIEFVSKGGQAAVITSLGAIGGALDQRHGTWIVP